MPTQADHALALAQQESDSDDDDELVGPLLPALAPPISEDELERRRIEREEEWKRVMASDGASEKTAGPVFNLHHNRLNLATNLCVILYRADVRNG